MKVWIKHIFLFVLIVCFFSFFPFSLLLLGLAIPFWLLLKKLGVIEDPDDELSEKLEQAAVSIGTFLELFHP